MNQDLTLAPGQVIDGRWENVVKLGAGAFGAVYKVRDLQGEPGEKGLYALKVESVNDRQLVLKMEVYVLETLEQSGARHVCRIPGKGRTDLFNYVVMTLVGKNLTDLRKARTPEKYSLSTALRTGIQCLEALEDLHAIGYLHRDVKPGNYATGRPEIGEARMVYILDYGMCRKYINARGEIRAPRAVVGFRGTTRYAALNTHLGREWSRKDDVETWFYQQIEMTKGGVPWRTLTNKDEVQKAKEHCRTDVGLQEMLADTPAAQFVPIFRYIDTITYQQKPDYARIYSLMREAMRTNRVSDSDPYDWEQISQQRKMASSPALSRSHAPKENDGRTDDMDEMQSHIGAVKSVFSKSKFKSPSKQKSRSSRKQKSKSSSKSKNKQRSSEYMMEDEDEGKKPKSKQSKRKRRK